MSVVVVGSANLDLVYRAPIPAPGETVLATGRTSNPGGKGANQAVAAARAGADTAFVGALGDDDAAGVLLTALGGAGVRSVVRRVPGPSGSALIVVDDAGENAIVVDPGANGRLDGLDADQRAAVRAADVVLLQLEIPVATVVDAAREAHAAGAVVVLNAAPAQSLPDALLADVDLLVVNEHEAAALGGAGTAERAVDALLERVPAAVVTLGARGALVAARDAAPTTVPGHRVTAVDTTGAGDTFCGTLVAALAAGDTLVGAVELATAAAALSVQRVGAVPSIPTREEIDDFHAQR